MGTRSASYVDWQKRAEEFAVGDMVYPFLGSSEQMGRVVAVFPAIGMVDVSFPHGTSRMPVEELQHFDVAGGASFPNPSPETHESVPGGASTVLTESPESPAEAPPVPKTADHLQVRRVAEAWVKRALYWAAADRHYRGSKEECASGQYQCPKCREATLRKAIYKRSEGKSERLLGCPQCLFLIKQCDIIGDPSYVDDQAAPANSMGGS